MKKWCAIGFSFLGTLIFLLNCDNAKPPTPKIGFQVKCYHESPSVLNIDVTNITDQKVYNVNVWYYKLQSDGTTRDSQEINAPAGIGDIDPHQTKSWSDAYLFSECPPGIGIQNIIYTETPDWAIKPTNPMKWELTSNGIK